MLARLLAMVRPGFVTEPLLEPRLCKAQALGLAAAAVGPCPPGQELLSASLHLTEDRLVWTVSSFAVGATMYVRIDDATGAVGPVECRGLR